MSEWNIESKYGVSSGVYDKVLSGERVIKVAEPLVMGMYEMAVATAETRSSAQTEWYSGLSDKVASVARVVVFAGPLAVGVDAVAIAESARSSA